MLYIKYLYYLAMRYDQGEASFGKSDVGFFARANAFLCTGPAILIIVITPISVISDLLGLNDAFVPTCRLTVAHCGSFAFPLLLSIIAMIIIERYWLYPGLVEVQKEIWKLGRPSPIFSALFVAVVAMVFAIPVWLSTFYPLIGIVLWALMLFGAPYLLRFFLLPPSA